MNEEMCNPKHKCTTPKAFPFLITANQHENHFMPLISFWDYSLAHLTRHSMASR